MIIIEEITKLKNKQIMEEDLRLFRDYRIAIFELVQKGTVLTSLIEVTNGTFTRVSITIDNVSYFAEHEDQMIATIHLRNQI